MKIVHISSEQVPFIKTGGLADVVGALSLELSKQGHDVVAFLPLYREVKESKIFKKAVKRHSLSIPLGKETVEGEVYKVKLGKHLDLYLINREEYYDRSNPYGTGTRDYSDNNARYIFYCKAVVETLLRENMHADILHCHDWQAALVPLFARVEEVNKGIQVGARSLLTIHNLAFQGLFDEGTFKMTNLPDSFNSIEGLEYYGQTNFLKGGILFSDAVTTVSHTYAKEILEPENGCGLDGVLEKRKSELYSIINGVDTDIWDPKKDPYLPANYSASNLNGKAKCKQALLKHAGLSGTDSVPVFGIVSRLTDQKGIDFIFKNKAFFADNDVRLIILGSGDPKLESALNKLMKKYPEKVYICQRYDEELSHLIEAGSDFFLMPSRFEPCGLNQLYSQRYGTVPLVSKVGGLADTVIDNDEFPRDGTGIVVTPDELGVENGLLRSLKLYVDKPKMEAVQRRGMAKDFSWKNAAKEYEELYVKILFGETQTHNPWGQ